MTGAETTALRGATRPDQAGRTSPGAAERHRSPSSGGTPLDALAAEQERLLACVHCGFCLDACPTYTRLGDESDSPRGRIYLMRAVAEGRLEPDAGGFRTHIDRCLGCRACEPVCPSGVQYGFLLERARAVIAAQHGTSLLARALLATFASRALSTVAGAVGRLLRAGGLARAMARALPRRFARARLALAMLAATRPAREALRAQPAAATVAGPQYRDGPAAEQPRIDADRASRRPRVAILEGCVQRVLFEHVNQATIRVLHVHGCEVIKAPGQGCCGALHAHAGRLDAARALALANIAAFEASGAELIAVNAAGCSAMMKEYGELFEHTEHEERARASAMRVRDAAELIAAIGPVTGGPVPLRVAYTAPCHLTAQHLARTPIDLLARAVPGLDIVMVEHAEECCGGAGIYALTQAELGARILDDKVHSVRAAKAGIVLTANPGCIMQIGAGLILDRGLDREPDAGAWPAVPRRRSAAAHGILVLHPFELLDESYRRAIRARRTGTEQ